MSDDGEKNEKKAKPQTPFDLSDLADYPPEETETAQSVDRPGTYPTRGALSDQLAKQAEIASQLVEDRQWSDELEAIRNLQERMDSLAQAAGPATSLGKLAVSIGEQERYFDAIREAALGPRPAIEELREGLAIAGAPIGADRADTMAGLPTSALERSANGLEDAGLFSAVTVDREDTQPELPELPEIPIVEHPGHETNDLLESIDVRFKRMEALVTRTAETTTNLQAAAAELLQDFKSVATENSNATKRTIWIARIAVIVAFTMPAVQILYAELRRSPENPILISNLLKSCKVSWLLCARRV